MDREVMTNENGRYHENRSQQEVAQRTSSNMAANRHETERESPGLLCAEAAVLGGIGIAILVGPEIYDFLKERLTPYVTIARNYITTTSVYQTLEQLNRKRKVGSIIRVIGTLAPNRIFPPASRIYIAPIRGKPLLVSHPVLTNVRFEEKRIPAPDAYELDDIVVAFEKDSDDELLEGGGINPDPEGWENPRWSPKFDIRYSINNEFRRSSTPKNSAPLTRKLLDSERTEPLSSISMVSEANTMYSEAAQGEIADLKCMVQALMTQMNQLVVSNQVSQVDHQVSNMQQPAPAPPAHFSLFSESTMNKDKDDDSGSSTKTITMEPVVNPPPPPPPPPMPNFSLGNKPLKLVNKKTKEAVVEKPQPTLTDVLKELPSAKLRRIDRSPGGTPLKRAVLKPVDIENDIGAQLALALKKRFDSMHSPVRDDDDSDFSGTTDKENVDFDSFDDSPIQSKPTISSTRRSRSLRRSIGEAQQQFGQHILKKKTIPSREGDRSKILTTPLR